MSGNTFVSSRLDVIASRFNEIEILLQLTEENVSHPARYAALCRSAHVLLVSHVEGIYKDIVKDVIDDLNFNTDFFCNVKKDIFKTHSLHFIHTVENDKSAEKIKEKLWNAFKDCKTQLILEPFLRTDNKNPTPQILEEILKKFGEEHFFRSLIESRLEVVFENNKKLSLKELEKIKRHTTNGVQNFPYTLDKSYFYNFNLPNLGKDKKGLFEEFLNQFLNDRHKIVHGQALDNPKNHTEILESKVKIEILMYAFIICLCHLSNPVALLN
ncbi:HEPN domain-containing protein [Chryseobacterium sp. OV279]|uniref:HEPN domain-containing protein n=1 Tax=Chryseobacterium sp. OV279 TaxID=1500285 RepID=UPI000913D1D1|nr:HEPN domain-containing protein [Chryseobacterium sp. OV279]SHF60221.1 hypothetical protein SAMN02787100_2470 [Chryseobacterium sp. OV279]